MKSQFIGNVSNQQFLAAQASRPAVSAITNAARLLAVPFAVLCLAVLPARATVFVSGTGSDTNPCTASLPCRQITHALTVVPVDGQVVVMAPGDFDPFTVNKAVSVVAPPGILAAITNTSGFAVIVSAGANDNVVLSGLDLSNQGSSTGRGVGVYSGWVTIDHCYIHDILSTAIFNDNAGGRLYVKDTFITTDAYNGPGVDVFAGQAVIENSSIQIGGGTASGVGVFAEGSSSVVVRDSELKGNNAAGGSGVMATSTSRVLVDHCVLTNHYSGAIEVNNSAVVELTNNTFAFNTLALNQLATTAQIISFKNNTFSQNTADGAFTSLLSVK